MLLSITKLHSRALLCCTLARRANQRLVLCVPVLDRVDNHFYCCVTYWSQTGVTWQHVALPNADDKHHITAHCYNVAEQVTKITFVVDGIRELGKGTRPLHLLLNNLNQEGVS